VDLERDTTGSAVSLPATPPFDTARFGIAHG
jgi:hypothetical protein